MSNNGTGEAVYVVSVISSLLVYVWLNRNSNVLHYWQNIIKILKCEIKGFCFSILVLSLMTLLHKLHHRSKWKDRQGELFVAMGFQMFFFKCAIRFCTYHRFTPWSQFNYIFVNLVAIPLTWWQTTIKQLLLLNEEYLKKSLKISKG